MRHVSRMGVLLPALLLVVASGCATKGWVREELGKQQAEMGQRIGQVDERVGSETQRVDKRVDSVEGRVSQEAQKVGEHGRPGGRARVVDDLDQRGRESRPRARRRCDGQGG